MQGRNTPGKRKSQCKGPEVGVCLICLRTVRRPVWQEQSVGVGRGECGLDCTGPWGTLGFDFE